MTKAICLLLLAGLAGCADTQVFDPTVAAQTRFGYAQYHQGDCATTAMAKPNYADLARHLPAMPQDATPEQLNDQAYVDRPERSRVAAYFAEWQHCRRDTRVTVAMDTPEDTPVFDQYAAQHDAAIADLTAGTITWGAFNARMQAKSIAYQTAVATAFQTRVAQSAAVQTMQRQEDVAAFVGALLEGVLEAAVAPRYGYVGPRPVFFARPRHVPRPLFLAASRPVFGGAHQPHLVGARSPGPARIVPTLAHRHR